MKIAGVDVVATAKATLKDFRKDDLQGLAAEVAYHFLFSIVPLVIFLTAMSGFISRMVGVNDAMSSITTWLFENLPTEAAEAVREPIQNVITNQSGGFLSFGAVLALWGGKNAMAALMKALNTAFGVEDSRPWWKKQAIAMGLTVAMGLAIVAASSFFLAGSFVGEGLANVLGLGDTWTTVWSILRFPLIALLLVVALAFLYWAGPDVDAPFKWLTAGSILAVVLWIIATFGLSIYFQFAGPSAETYGALSGVLAFVFWLYVMSLILLLGGELNSVLAVQQVPAVRAEVSAKGGDAKVAEQSTGFPRPIVAGPSAALAARQALAAEGAGGQQRRGTAALTTLGASVAAAVSTVVLTAVRRSRGQ